MVLDTLLGIGLEISGKGCTSVGGAGVATGAMAKTTPNINI